MVMVKEDNCDVSKVTSFLQKHVPRCYVDQNIGTELSYVLPDDDAKLFPNMFRDLEEKQEKLHINSYGISVTTMEEVFIK